MPTNLFSTYSTPENRITASILAVLRSLSLDRIDRLLGALQEQSEFELVAFRNQPPKSGDSVPDAEIFSSVRLLVETKIQRGAVSEKQIKNHVARFELSKEEIQKLLVITPDNTCPPLLTTLGDNRVVWASFAALDQAIDELLADNREVVSEREAFLLRELQMMFVRENLVGSSKDVVVVAARTAWPEYQQHVAYICQPDRPFQNVARMAFYSHGQIHPQVPRILECHDRVALERNKYVGKLDEIIDAVLHDPQNDRKEGLEYKVLILSAPDSPDTTKLEGPVLNNLTSESGRTVAFTQNQRYVSLGRLRSAKNTSDLIE